MTLPSRRVVAGMGGLAALALVVGAIVSGPGLKVAGRGHFVPYTEHEVVRVEAFHSFTFLAAPETRRDDDLINGVLLGVLGGVAGLAALLTMTADLDRHLLAFFTFASAGGLFLSFAEIFELDETLGYNVQWIDHMPGLTGENLDLVLLAPAATLFLWFFRDILLSSPAALWFWIVGAALFFATLGMDLLLDTPVEDTVEVVASSFLLAGFSVLAVDRLRASVRLAVALPRTGRTAT